MLIINNEATADDYSNALTLESLFGGRLVYLVANASAIARFRPIPDLVVGAGSKVSEYGQEQVLTPQSSFIDKISGVKFRSAVAGAPARIVATLSEPGDILPASGTPFTGVLTASGAVGVGVGVLDRSTSTVDVQASAAEAALYSFLVPAGTMGVDSMLRLTVQGDVLFNNAVGNTIRFRVRFGGSVSLAGTIIFSDDRGAIGVVSGVRQPWRFQIEIPNLGARNSNWLSGDLISWAPDTTAPTTGAGVTGLRYINTTPGQGSFGVVAPTAIDTATDSLLELTCQWSAASANNSFRKRYALLEIL